MLCATGRFASRTGPLGRTRNILSTRAGHASGRGISSAGDFVDPVVALASITAWPAVVAASDWSSTAPCGTVRNGTPATIGIRFAGSLTSGGPHAAPPQALNSESHHSTNLPPTTSPSPRPHLHNPS